MVQEVSTKCNREADKLEEQSRSGTLYESFEKYIFTGEFNYLILHGVNCQNIQLFHLYYIFVFCNQHPIFNDAWHIEHSALFRWCIFQSISINDKETQMFHERKRAGLSEKQNTQAKRVEVSSKKWSQAQEPLIMTLLSPCLHCQPNLQHISVSKPAQKIEL